MTLGKSIILLITTNASENLILIALSNDILVLGDLMVSKFGIAHSHLCVWVQLPQMTSANDVWACMTLVVFLILNLA